MPSMQRHHVIGLCLLVLLSLSAVVHTIFFSEGWEKRQSLKEEVAERALANDLAEKESQKLRERIQAIRERPDVQERLVRDQAGFVKPEEVILEMNP
jgi:cell division protein FtsB